MYATAAAILAVSVAAIIVYIVKSVRKSDAEPTGNGGGGGQGRNRTQNV